MLKVRGGMAAFQIEMGRWHGLKREEVCKECDRGEVEDVCHWLLQCFALNSLRQPLLHGSHERCRGRLLDKRQWRQNSPYIITCMQELSHFIYISLTLCGQLGSSNQSALFIHCHY